MAIAFRPSLPVLDSKTQTPAWLFDGTPRLYICLKCPFAQRVWMARNFKVPSLEHNGKVTGESLDLLEYFEKNFEGPSIFPSGLAKEAATKELFEYSNELNKQSFTILRNKEATKTMAEETLDPAFDHLEAALGKFAAEGPYFLGAISGVDFAYAPFMERYQLLLPELSNYHPLKGRPKLNKWFEAMNTVDAYTNTKLEPNVLLSVTKKFIGR